MPTNEQQVHNVYIAYYGRPADPAGRDFWISELGNNGGDLSAIIDAFATSTEFQDRFGGFSHGDLVNNIYQFLFNRDADAAGKAFYVDLLDTGARSLGTIALNILDGAQNDDFTLVNQKLYASENFAPVIALYDIKYGAGEIDAAKAILDAITITQTKADIIKLLEHKVLEEFPANSVINGTSGDDVVEGTQFKDELAGNGGSDTFKLNANDVVLGIDIPQYDRITDYQSDDILDFSDASPRTITSDLATPATTQGFDGVTATVSKGFVSFVTGGDGLSLGNKTDFVQGLIDDNSLGAFQHGANSYLIQDTSGSLTQFIELVGTSMDAVSVSQDSASTIVIA